MVLTVYLVAGAACGRFGFTPCADHNGGLDSSVDSGYAAAVLRSNPLAYWRFDDTRTPTAIDASGNGYDGTYAAVVLERPGAVGDGNTAVELLNVTGAQIDMGNVFGFEGNATFTIEMWANPIGADGLLVGKNDWNSTTGLYEGWLIYHGQTATQIRRAAESIAAPPIPVGEYSHVVATYDGVTMVIYVNGVAGEARPTTTKMPVAVSPFLVGRQANGQWAAYVGVIDELAVYDYALTPTEVSEHYRIVRP